MSREEPGKVLVSSVPSEGQPCRRGGSSDEFSGAAQWGQAGSALHLHRDPRCFLSALDTEDARRKLALNRKTETIRAFLKVGIVKGVGCALLILAHIISLKQGKSRMLVTKHFMANCNPGLASGERLQVFISGSH